MVRIYLTLLLASLMTAGAGQAQNGKPPSLPGEILPATLDQDTRKANLLVTSLRLASNFDDNALNDNLNRQYVVSNVIEPRLGWAVIHPRANWTIDYRFGLSRSYPLAIYDSWSHLLDATLQFNLTRRLKMRLLNQFSQSRDPFDLPLNPNSPVGLGILDRPNEFVLGSAISRTSEQAGLDLTYALGPHTVAGVGGSFVMVNYGAPPAGQPAQIFDDFNSSSGHAFYFHHFTPRYWAGLDYSTRLLISRSGASRDLVNSLFYTQTLVLTPSTAISAFAGPEQLTPEAETVAAAGLPAAMPSRWQWAGGATYNWTRDRLGLVIGGYRKISDGGGVLGTVRVSSASAELRTRLPKRWTASFAGAYDRNLPLFTGLAPLSFVSASAGVTRPITQDLSIEVRYLRAYVPNNSLTASLADHNRVTVSLAYDFKSPLGR